MAVPNKMASAYEGLVEAFRRAGEDSNCGPLYSSLPPRNCFALASGAACATFGCTFLLKNYRWRNSSRSTDTVDILVKAQETIQLNPLVLTQSTVRVNYFVVEGSRAKLVECVHYDYCHPPQDDQHPIFHAQFGDEAIVLDGSLRTEFGYHIDADGFRCFKNARIPTADMTLCSVLLSLAADHMRCKFFLQFRDKFLALQESLPRPAIEDLKWSLSAEIADLKCSHWFARQPKEA